MRRRSQRVSGNLYVEGLQADELLFGKLSTGGNVRIYVKDDELAFDLESSDDKA